MRREGSRGWCGLVVALSIASTALAASHAGAESAGDLQDELQRQQELLQRLEAGEPLGKEAARGAAAAPTPAQRGVPSDTGPRIAPAAPEERNLPEAIFEKTRVTVPADTWGNRNKLVLVRLVLDADGDGQPELTRYVDPESKFVVRQEEDRNYDGTTDAWSDYEWGAIVRRVLDSNDDGNRDTWERYKAGHMVSRDIDRDDDGVRDAFYRYEGFSLAEEKHDANNDGTIDLIVTFEHRRRKRSEEDRDHDGRMDTWTTYRVANGVELVARVERDMKGRGFADTFETFEVSDGKAQLVRREEDVSGNREIDIVSIYENGKLVRREISDPSLLPM